MRLFNTRITLVCVFLLTQLSLSVQAWAEDEQPMHPLAIHMNQWLSGSREWSTPNPDYDPAKVGGFTEYRVRWDWGPFRQQLLGKLFGVRADGSTVLFWSMYATHNPVSKTMVFQQIGWSGDYIHGEHPLRQQALEFGEIEQLDTTMYQRDGTAKITRHENTFTADGTHHANVFEKNEEGDWELKNQWDWRLVAEHEVIGQTL